MSKTPLTAAVPWTGTAFEVDELPYFMVQALGSGALTINGAALAIETEGGPVSVAAGDVLTLDETGAVLGAVTEEELRNDYEVTPT